jgi:hypothetical protein
VLPPAVVWWFSYTCHGYRARCHGCR